VSLSDATNYTILEVYHSAEWGCRFWLKLRDKEERNPLACQRTVPEWAYYNTIKFDTQYL